MINLSLKLNSNPCWRLFQHFKVIFPKGVRTGDIPNCPPFPYSPPLWQWYIPDSCRTTCQICNTVLRALQQRCAKMADSAVWWTLCRDPDSSTTASLECTTFLDRWRGGVKMAALQVCIAVQTSVIVLIVGLLSYTAWQLCVHLHIAVNLSSPYLHIPELR